MRKSMSCGQTSEVSEDLGGRFLLLSPVTTAADDGAHQGGQKQTGDDRRRHRAGQALCAQRAQADCGRLLNLFDGADVTV